MGWVAVGNGLESRQHKVQRVEEMYEVYSSGQYSCFLLVDITKLTFTRLFHQLMCSTSAVDSHR